MEGRTLKAAAPKRASVGRISSTPAFLFSEIKKTRMKIVTIAKNSSQILGKDKTSV